jgi:hypothetical protein
MSVATKLGATAFTATVGANSLASAAVNVFSAPLDAEYAALPVIAANPRMDETLTIRP